MTASTKLVLVCINITILCAADIKIILVLLSYDVNWVQQHIQYSAPATVSEGGFAVAKMPFHEWWDQNSAFIPPVGAVGLCLWSGSFNLISGLTLIWQASSIEYSINLEIYTVYMSSRETCLFESEPACTSFRVDDVDFAHTCLAGSLAET